MTKENHENRPICATNYAMLLCLPSSEEEFLDFKCLTSGWLGVAKGEKLLATPKLSALKT